MSGKDRVVNRRSFLKGTAAAGLGAATAADRNERNTRRAKFILTGRPTSSSSEPGLGLPRPSWRAIRERP